MIINRLVKSGGLRVLADIVIMQQLSGGHPFADGLDLADFDFPLGGEEEGENGNQGDVDWIDRRGDLLAAALSSASREHGTEGVEEMVPATAILARILGKC